MSHAPHQQRVIEERDQLRDRLTKLVAFVDSPKLQQLPANENVLLQSQVAPMQAYLDILNERIALWPATAVDVAGFVDSEAVKGTVELG